PHARGGVSSGKVRLVNLLQSSPRTWGCFLSWTRWHIRFSVFPTHVGVFPSHGQKGGFFKGLPHARGGVSPPPTCGTPTHVSSPRTWGCFSLSFWSLWCIVVFPTHVGVFLKRQTKAQKEAGLPHARGGVS